jgi:hypothetical protein
LEPELRGDATSQIQTRSQSPALVAQLKYYRYSGRFPCSAGDIPPTILHYLANQVGADVDHIKAYDWSGRTGTRHRRGILQFLGVRRVSAEDKARFSNWLIEHAYSTGSDISDAHEHAFEWFRHRKKECPVGGQLDRLARSAYQQFEATLFKKISAQLSPACCQRLDSSLESEDGEAEFSKTKADPGRVGLDSVLKEIAKLAFINTIEMPENAWNDIHPKVLHRYRQRI